MEVNLLRSLITVLCFSSFIGIAFWAYSARHKERFDAAAQIPFLDDDVQQQTIAGATAAAGAATESLNKNKREIANG